MILRLAASRRSRSPLSSSSITAALKHPGCLRCKPPSEKHEGFFPEATEEGGRCECYGVGGGGNGAGAFARALLPHAARWRCRPHRVGCRKVLTVLQQELTKGGRANGLVVHASVRFLLIWTYNVERSSHAKV
jgi:hypothetical protein